jgi:hypothetical protein
MFSSPMNSSNHSTKLWGEVISKDKFSQSSVFYSISISSSRECDALIVSTSYVYDSVSLDAVKQWLSDIQKEVHVLGPLLPPGYGTKTQDSEEGTSADIEKFLGEMLVQHGKQSVFFVRPFPLLRLNLNA